MQTEKQLQYFGSGLQNIFPKENTELFNVIIDSGGLIITEYLPDVKAKSENFPYRNRIISGISLGVLVVEAKHRSGASLTANIAKQQRKKVFCIPANLDNKYLRTNELIREGATLVNTEKDILNELGFLETDNFEAPVCASITSSNNSTIQKHISQEYMPVYNTLSKEPIHINQICKILNDSVSNVGSILTMLELEGNVEQLPGKMFKIY